MSLSIDATAAFERTSCYHCGERVPAGVELGVLIGGEFRPMCCPGCRAVAELISTSGLDSFYRQRTAFSQRPPERESIALEQYLVYDDPALAASFADTASDGQMTARLLLGGISCAACTWLIEQTMVRLPGVSLALVNLQQSRLDIRFDPAQIPLSRIFTRLDALGYQVRPFQASARRAQMWEESRQELRRLGVAALGMMQVGMFSMALYAGDIQGIEIQYQGLLRWVSLVIASFVVLFSSRVFFTTAWRHLRQGALVMDLPVALAIGLAWLASVWATIINSGQVYFDSVVMFTFFLLLGRFFERRMRMRYNLAWFDAESALPDAVTARRGGEWATLPRVKLQAGDTILVRAGDTVPADVRITAGNSAVREDTFNGESLPRSVAIGDTVYASTVNVEAALEGQVLGNYRDSRLAALQCSVEQGQVEKPRLARIADRVASWFVGAILIITALTALVWSQIAPEQVFWISLAVLVISCPCALALATPAALTSAASALRGAGVIVRGENALEALSRATHLLFDKTGTLTAGSLAIARVQLLAEQSREQVLAIAAAMQQYSSHPVAKAFSAVTAAGSLHQVQYQVGAGLEAREGDHIFRMGSEQFCRSQATTLPPPPDEPFYWIALCRDELPLAWIGLDDRIRPEAAAVIAAARQAGLEVELLTGDSSAQGVLLARGLGIDTVMTGLAPEQKMERVQALQRTGAVVAMVGDGLNDAPVLSLADASFAVAGATDLARAQADFVLAEGDLHSVTATLYKARQCRSVIKQNLAWALGYNAIGIPLAALGFIPPWAAAIGMSLSSLLVVANSLRLNGNARSR